MRTVPWDGMGQALIGLPNHKTDSNMLNEHSDSDYKCQNDN